jgi:hypothetical protein
MDFSALSTGFRTPQGLPMVTSDTLPVQGGAQLVNELPFVSLGRPPYPIPHPLCASCHLHPFPSWSRKALVAALYPEQTKARGWYVRLLCTGPASRCDLGHQASSPVSLIHITHKGLRSLRLGSLPGNTTGQPAHPSLHLCSQASLYMQVAPKCKEAEDLAKLIQGALEGKRCQVGTPP